MCGTIVYVHGTSGASISKKVPHRGKKPKVVDISVYYVRVGGNQLLEFSNLLPEVAHNRKTDMRCVTKLESQ
jgi:hypothetical protein